MSFTVVQSTVGGTSQTLTGVVAGHAIIAIMWAFKSGTGLTFTGLSDGVNSYAQDHASGSIAEGGNDSNYAAWSGIVATGGSLTLTTTLSGADIAAEIIFFEVASTGGKPALVGSGSSSATSATMSAGNVATAGNSAVFAIGHSSGGATTPTVQSGWTQSFNSGNLFAQYILNTSVNPTVPSVTIVSGAWSMAGFAYEEASLDYALTGPTAGNTLVASTNFTVTPNGTVTDAITFSDGSAGGTFTPTSLSWTALSSAKTFTYTPSSSVGAKTLTLTSGNGYTITGNGVVFTAAANYTLAGPANGASGHASTNFTLTPATALTDTITFSDGAAGGTFTPTSLTFATSSVAQTFTYTPASTGAKTLTLASGNSFTFSGNAATYTALAAATGYTPSGPLAGIQGATSGPISLTPNGFVVSDSVTISASVGGGTITTSPVAFANTGSAHTFTYTPASGYNGPVTFTFTSSGSLTIATFLYDVVVGVSYITEVSGLASGYASSATVATYVKTGGQPTSVTGCTVGTITEDTVTAGTYRAVVTYLQNLVPSGTLPHTTFTVNGVTAPDPNPIPTATGGPGANF